MIYLLKGKIHSKDHKSVVININGIGFRVFCSERTLNELAKNDNEVEVFTYHYLRENAMELYGFLNPKELEIFELLISIPGIGPKGALNILTVVSIETLKRAIANEESAVLTKVSGIGRKIAEKIVLELKNKVGDEFVGKSLNEDTETIDALVSLGYKVQEAREAVKKLPKDIEGVENRVKEALKLLGK